MILVDTNVISELMRKEPSQSVLFWMDSQPASMIGTTAITLAEILYGIATISEGRRKHQLMEAAAELFEVEFRGVVYGFDQYAAVEYADIVSMRRRNGLPVSMADAQIAAICRSTNCAIATRNEKDFTDTGIEVINPWKK